MLGEGVSEALPPGAVWCGDMPAVIINENYRCWEQRGVCVCVYVVGLRMDN